MKLKNSIIFSLLLLLSFSVRAHKETFWTYQGLIDTDTLYLEMHAHDGEYAGRYFRTADLIDHDLHFTKEGDKLIISDGNLINLHALHADHHEKPHFHSEDGIKLTFLSQKDNYYKDTKVSYLKFIEISKNEHRTLYKEQRSGITFFQLNSETAKQLNEQLHATHINLSMVYFSSHINRTTFSAAHEIHFLNDTCLSYSTEIHSNGMTEKTYYNVRSSGESLQLEDFFYVGNTNQPKPRHQSQEWFKYRYARFPKALMPLLKLKGNSCLNNPVYWQFPSWHLTEEGIVFLPVSAAPNGSCALDQEFLVKYGAFIN